MMPDPRGEAQERDPRVLSSTAAQPVCLATPVEEHPDTKRLDWLESKVWVGDLCVPGLEAFTEFTEKFIAPDVGKYEGEPEDASKSYIREAIDAAMSASTPKEKP